ncbi:MAG TPA: hypothetical protein VH877_21115 [Polyangia bacterium]|nr:hypothetical protein [Polyangia bacterium]
MRPQRAEDRASRQHRAALEALFAKGDLGKLVEKLSPPDMHRGGDKTSSAAADAPPAGPPRTAVTVGAADSESGSRAALRKKILEAVGREQISRAIDKYVQQHRLPADFEVLEQALEHLREERVSEALVTLEQLLEKEKPRRSRALAGKLRFIEETSHNEELRQRATQIRAKLG